MNNELVNYINNPDDPIANLYLGCWYEQQRHFSPASSYYLRCAELTDNIDLRYEALLRTTFCYRNVNRRDYTVESLLKNAICLCPQRQEAYYFLAQHYENKGNWLDSYTYSSMGLANGKNSDIKPLTNLYYGGKYYLMMQKASSGWWVGKPSEARSVYQDMVDNYSQEMTKEFQELLQHNICRIGHGPAWESVRKYTKGLHERLKFKFRGSNEIVENYSQAYQDMMLLAVYNGKKNGTYLEIGSSQAFHMSNTALLEKLDWIGIGLELDENFVEQHSKSRKNPVLCQNALDIDYLTLLKKYFPDTKNIDYLQVDIEPAKNTFQCLFSIPFDEYRFGIITYEHDYYADVTRSFRTKSRRYLKSLGYELLVNDISVNGLGSFEDWWYHPELVDPDRVSLMKSIDLDAIHIVEKYMLDN